MDYKYYTEIYEDHKKSCMFKLLVNWKPEEIVGNDGKSGYIVQHFMRTLSASRDITIPHNTSYYEAWRVLDGKVANRDSFGDDEFSIGNDFEYFDLFNKCVGTSGKYVLRGEVYWISESNPLYPMVDAWETNVKDAGGLKFSYECKELETIVPLFSRNPFVHEWNLVDDMVVFDTARKMFFNYCHKEDSHDELVSTANKILPDQYADMRRKIIEEWESQWK